MIWALILFVGLVVPVSVILNFMCKNPFLACTVAGLLTTLLFLAFGRALIGGGKSLLIEFVVVFVYAMLISTTVTVIFAGVRKSRARRK